MCTYILSTVYCVESTFLCVRVRGHKVLPWLLSVLAHLHIVEILIGEDRPPKLVLTGVNYASLNL